MAKKALLARWGIVRSGLRQDLFQFVIPAIIVFFIELSLCESHGNGISGFWGTVWSLVRRPQNLSVVSAQRIFGLALFFAGLAIMIVGQATLWRNYSGTVVIREGHQLVTHGIYRFTRNPIYLGGIMATTALPVYAASRYGFIASLVLIPIILNRIRLEEKLLAEEFQDSYQKYKETTKRVIPFIF